MGSSIVIMWCECVSLIQFIIDASDVVFPDPVGPVTKNNPRGRVMRSLTTGGRPICSIVRNSLGIRRSTMAIVPFCLKTLTRNRALSP